MALHVHSSANHSCLGRFREAVFADEECVCGGTSSSVSAFTMLNCLVSVVLLVEKREVDLPLSAGGSGSTQS